VLITASRVLGHISFGISSTSAPFSLVDTLSNFLPVGMSLAKIGRIFLVHVVLTYSLDAHIY
jgi:hypothetical protein